MNSMKDVQKRTENVNTEENPSGWRPYYTFIDSLREKYAKNEGFQGSLCNFFHFLLIVPYSQILFTIKQQPVRSLLKQNI